MQKLNQNDDMYLFEYLQVLILSVEISCLK